MVEFYWFRFLSPFQFKGVSMATVYQKALSSLNTEIVRVQGEIDTLPWYSFFKRESLTRELEQFETRWTHLRAEQCYPESANNDSYMILLQQEYKQHSPAHRDVLYSIVHGNPRLQM